MADSGPLDGAQALMKRTSVLSARNKAVFRMMLSRLKNRSALVNTPRATAVHGEIMELFSHGVRCQEEPVNQLEAIP